MARVKLCVLYPAGTLLQDCARFLHQAWTALRPILALILQESCKCKGYDHFLAKHLHLSCKLCKNLARLACKVISLAFLQYFLCGCKVQKSARFLHGKTSNHIKKLPVLSDHFTVYRAFLSSASTSTRNARTCATAHADRFGHTHIACSHTSSVSFDPIAADLLTQIAVAQR